MKYAALFLTIALSIYLGMHLYVFVRLGGMLGFQRGVILLSIPVGLAALLPLSMIVERAHPSLATRGLYTVAVTWLGVLWLLFSALFLSELISLFITFDRRIVGFTIIVAVALLSLIGIVNASFVRLKTVEIPMKGLSREMKVVHLSDIHLGTVRNSGYLKDIVGRTNRLEPDLVLITGDMVDGSGALTEHSYLPLADLEAPVFFTTGNHERYMDTDRILSLLKDSGVRVLRNEVVTAKGIQIIGIDDSDDFSRGNKALSGIKFNSKKPSILMYHRPEGLVAAAERGVNLQLSGHTHNGQIWPFNLIVALFNSYTYGLHEHRGTYLYVSPGTGTWGPPMRLGTSSEITLIRLKP
jgi:uncharacterized protein